MFHVEPEAVFGRDGSLSFERPDRMSHEGTAAVPEALAFVGSDAPSHQVQVELRRCFQVELRACSTVGARLGGPDGLDVHVEPGGPCVVGRHLQIRTPGPDD
jgi:hypothetical protein